MPEPGGHSPASFVILNDVPRSLEKKLGMDPTHVPEFPEFGLAHEIAHQWWGQSVGWRTYHDEWLSEGFAHFAAWEYIGFRYGAKDYERLSKTFMKWIRSKSYAGPLTLGNRVGQIPGDLQAYTAIVYLKGAYTLHALRERMGPENFRRCLAEFYRRHRFQRVGSQEFQAIAQKHSDEDLAPFFQKWIYGWNAP
jgi:aminopeptidase N